MVTITLHCPPSASDEQLLRCFAAGDRRALEELFRRYRQPAYRVAFRLLGNEADALDAVQDGFVKALTHLQSFQGRSSFKTWLLRVVSNASLDLGRHRGRRGLERSDMRSHIDQALAKLSDAHRQTFVLHADAELSYREVADTLGISIGTVMSRLFYARQKLREYLNERKAE
jgi:RNA polymerase sigma-70 factor (ECF subfamily)